MTGPGPLDSTDPAGPAPGHEVDRVTGPVGPGRRRVHPVTPLLVGARALAATIAVIAFNVVQQASSLGDLVNFLTDSGLMVWLAVTGIALLIIAITAVLSWVSWKYRFFELADDEVRIGSGWLIRSRRTARFDRVQAVDINQPLLARIRGPIEQALKDAKLERSQIDEVILVGGSTRVPAVKRIVKELLGKEPNQSVNPDEVVALGAAVQAGVLTGIDARDLRPEPGRLLG